MTPFAVPLPIPEVRFVFLNLAIPLTTWKRPWSLAFSDLPLPSITPANLLSDDSKIEILEKADPLLVPLEISTPLKENEPDPLRCETRSATLRHMVW